MISQRLLSLDSPSHSVNQIRHQLTAFNEHKKQIEEWFKPFGNFHIVQQADVKSVEQNVISLVSDVSSSLILFCVHFTAQP
jgi:hypothetical protein